MTKPRRSVEWRMRALRNDVAIGLISLQDLALCVILSPVLVYSYLRGDKR